MKSKGQRICPYCKKVDLGNHRGRFFCRYCGRRFPRYGIIKDINHVDISENIVESIIDKKLFEERYKLI